MACRKIVKAPPQFSITIAGTTDAAGSRARIMPLNLPWLLDRLFTGETVALDELEAFGLRIWIEWDPDAWPTIGAADVDPSGAKP